MASPPRKKLRSGTVVPGAPRKKSLLSMVLSTLQKPKPDPPTDDEDEKAEKKPCPLDMLPDEVLGKCFFSGFVNSIDIITHVTFVNKRTREVAKKSVKMLDLRALPRITHRNVTTIVRRHATLSSLDFGYCQQFGRAHLMALIPISETLRCLRLRGSSLYDEDIVAYLDAVVSRLEGPSHLEELDLGAIKKQNEQRIGDEAVSKIVESCPELRTLQLGWCKGVTDKSLQSLKNLRRLNELDLSLTSVTDTGCGELASAYELRKLDLGANSLSDEGIQNLIGDEGKRVRRIQLEELRLCFNAAMTEKSLSLLEVHMPTLKVLDIRHCDLDNNDAKNALRELKRKGVKIEGDK